MATHRAARRTPVGSFNGQDAFTLKIIEPDGHVVAKHFDVTVGALLIVGSALTFGLGQVRRG